MWQESDSFHPSQKHAQFCGLPSPALSVPGDPSPMSKVSLRAHLAGPKNINISPSSSPTAVTGGHTDSFVSLCNSYDDEALSATLGYKEGISASDAYPAASPGIMTCHTFGHFPWVPTNPYALPHPTAWQIDVAGIATGPGIARSFPNGASGNTITLSLQQLATSSSSGPPMTIGSSQSGPLSSLVYDRNPDTTCYSPIKLPTTGFQATTKDIPTPLTGCSPSPCPQSPLSPIDLSSSTSQRASGERRDSESSATRLTNLSPIRQTMVKPMMNKHRKGGVQLRSALRKSKPTSCTKTHNSITRPKSPQQLARDKEHKGVTNKGDSTNNKDNNVTPEQIQEKARVSHNLAERQYRAKLNSNFEVLLDALLECGYLIEDIPMTIDGEDSAMDNSVAGGPDPKDHTGCHRDNEDEVATAADRDAGRPECERGGGVQGSRGRSGSQQQQPRRISKADVLSFAAQVLCLQKHKLEEKEKEVQEKDERLSRLLVSLRRIGIVDPDSLMLGSE